MTNTIVKGTPSEASLGSSKDLYEQAQAKMKVLDNKTITGRVKTILKSRNLDTTMYFEVEGNFYMQERFKYLNKDDLDQLIKTRNNYMVEKDSILAKLSSSSYIATNNTVDNYNNLTSNYSTGDASVGYRSASTQDYSSSIAIFTPFGLKDSIGVFTIGTETTWCSNMLTMSILKIRYSSPYKADLVCATNTINAGIMLSLSSFENGAFLEKKAIIDSLSIKNGDIDLIKNELGDGDVTESIFFGDFDGDGRDELGLAHSNGYRIYKHEAPPGEFTKQWVSRIGNSKETWCNESRNVPGNNAVKSIQRHGIRVGDFNGDGKDDLWCHNYQTGHNFLRFSNFTSTHSNPSNNWLIPAGFSLAGKVWCQYGNLFIGDFNGDGKSDVFCATSNVVNSVTSNPKFYFLFSLGDGRFVSRSGYGDGYALLGDNTNTVNNKLVWWDHGIRNWTISSVNKMSHRLQVGDFDGDGITDLMHTEDNGANKFLFGSLDEFFVSKSVSNYPSNGYTSLGNNAVWCSRYESTFVIGDFDGDEKDDIACMRDFTSTLGDDTIKHLLMFSKTSTSYLINLHRVDVVVSDYIITQQLNITESNLKYVSNHIICNNTVRPDDSLICKASTGMNLKNTDSIELNKAWMKTSEYIPAVTIGTWFRGSYSLTLNINDKQISKQNYIDTTSVSRSHIRSHSDEIDNSLESSSIVNVKSGECLKVTLTTKYASNITIPFNATGHFKSSTHYNHHLVGIDLLKFAKSLIDVPESYLTLNPFNDAEVIFPVTGRISGNIIGETDTYTEEC